MPVISPGFIQLYKGFSVGWYKHKGANVRGACKLQKKNASEWADKTNQNISWDIQHKKINYFVFHLLHLYNEVVKCSV